VSAKTKYLRRYTHLEALRNILCTKSLTLLDYRKWDDKNDSYFLHLYQEERELKSLLALCLTRSSERFHLWQVFGPKRERHSVKVVGQSLGCRAFDPSSPLARIGVRIRFDRSQLIEALGKYRGRVTWDDVDYLTYAQLEALGKKRKGMDPIAKLPFVKRYGFRDESEFRIMYESKRKTATTINIPIPLSCINRIILSYKLNYGNYKAIKDKLRSLDGCRGLDIRRSNLIESKTWKNAGAEAVKAAKQNSISQRPTRAAGIEPLKPKRTRRRGPIGLSENRTRVDN